MEQIKKTDTKKLAIGVACIVLYIILTIMPTPEGLSIEGQKALALMITSVIAWVSEVIPIGMSAPCKRSNLK
jgi:sodium-dependent dicarboxylate transporter 2/3/5